MPVPLSILLDKSIGHTSTNTKKYWQYFIVIPFYSILTILHSSVSTTRHLSTQLNSSLAGHHVTPLDDFSSFYVVGPSSLWQHLCMTACSTVVAQDHRRSCLPRRRCKSLEHASAGDYVTTVTGSFQARTEDGTLP